MVMFDDESWPVTTVRFGGLTTYSQAHAVIDRLERWLVRGDRFAIMVRLGAAFTARVEVPIWTLLLGWARTRGDALERSCAAIAWITIMPREPSLRLRFYTEAAAALRCPTDVFCSRGDARAWLELQLEGLPLLGYGRVNTTT